MRALRVSNKELRKEFHICEYPSVLDAAGTEGWLDLLIQSHLTPCSQDDAKRLLRQAGLNHIPMRFSMRSRARGRFSSPRRGRSARLSLPGRPGSRFGCLRVGIVLHEAAHALDYFKRLKANHQPPFRTELQRLLRKFMTTTPHNFRPIYDRHQGPYVLLLLRTNAKGEQFTDRMTGSSLRAQAAHEKAIDLINDRDPAKTDVQNVFVFSDTEGQFTGALYKRGEAYADWQHLSELDDDMPARPKRTGLTVKEAVALADATPLQRTTVAEQLDAVESPTTHAGLPTPRKPRATKLPGDRFPVMRGRPLVHNPEGKWPTSAPGQLVKSHFDMKGPGYSATTAELLSEIGPALTELGVGFPSSLISRLKQSGLLKEITYESQEPQGDAPIEDATVEAS